MLSEPGVLSLVGAASTSMSQVLINGTYEPGFGISGGAQALSAFLLLSTRTLMVGTEKIINDIRQC